MTSALQRTVLGVLVVLIALAGDRGARAQTDESDAAYRRTIAAAVDAFQQGHFALARDLFQRAHQLSPSARTLRGMGIADFEGGHYALALDEIEAALADARKPLDPDQRRDAEELVARGRLLVGTLRVRVTPASAALFINGVGVPGHDARLDPGDYVVRAVAEGYATSEASVHIDAGQEHTLELTLVPPTIARATEEPRNGRRTAALVVGGVGAAAVVVGSIFGIRSMVKHDESDKFCPRGACRDVRGVEAMNQARTAGDIATIAWVIGGLGLAGAGILWFTAPERAPETASQTRVSVGLAALQLETRW
jgi:hypothetical protein